MVLARRLALAFMLAMCVVLGLHGFLDVRREIAALEATAAESLGLAARTIAEAVRQVWRRPGELPAVFIAGKPCGGPLTPVEVRWVWLDAPPGTPGGPRVDGPELAPLRDGTAAEVAVPSEAGAGRTTRYVALRLPGLRPAAIEASMSPPDRGEHVRGLVRTGALTTLLLALVCGGVALRLGAALLGRPIERLVAQARRVGDGDFSVRLAPERDELGVLAAAMNDMVARLERARTRVVDTAIARVAALDQLRRADRLAVVGMLASSAIHELGTPLAVVSTRAGMLVSDGLGKDEVADAGRVIAEQADRMAATARRLLGLAGGGGTRRAPLDLLDAARRALSVVEPLARRHGVALVAEDAGAPCVARADEGGLHHVLTNLIVNGIQAMPRGGTLRVAAGVGRARPPAGRGLKTGRHAWVSIRDEGEGIDEDERARVFEPFYTTKGEGGTGLGLSIVEKIVGDHGGWISVESESGRGSSFTVFLPTEGGA